MFLNLDPSTLGFLLPFLLMLAIVYGALQMGGPFKSKGINFIIAVVLGFFAATYEPVVQFINQVLPYAAILFVVVFLIGFVKSKIVGRKPDFVLLAIVVGLAAVFLASPAGQEIFSVMPSSGVLSADNIAVAVAILFVLILLIASRKFWYDKHDEPHKEERR
jgi:uncharacterized membrane protein